MVDGMALLEGEVLNLTCETRGGNPLATLSWYKSSEKVMFYSNATSCDNQAVLFTFHKLFSSNFLVILDVETVCK